jgi:hypothetical protein
VIKTFFLIFTIGVEKRKKFVDDILKKIEPDGTKI